MVSKAMVEMAVAAEVNVMGMLMVTEATMELMA
jgi:hypothetical protein